MTRYYDGKKVLEISMIDENGIDFSADFFADGILPFDEEMDAYEVKFEGDSWMRNLRAPLFFYCAKIVRFAQLEI